jgi:protein associated with RNAse G/E
LVLVGEFKNEVRHSKLGVIRRGTVSYEYYWLDRWFNVFRFHEPGGELRNYYCNVNLPPSFENGVLDYIDLDIDVLVWRDFKYEILDLDEFEQNAVLYGYSDELIGRSRATLDEIQEMIKIRRFPFS